MLSPYNVTLPQFFLPTSLEMMKEVELVTLFNRNFSE